MKTEMDRRDDLAGKQLLQRLVLKLVTLGPCGMGHLISASHPLTLIYTHTENFKKEEKKTKKRKRGPSGGKKAAAREIVWSFDKQYSFHNSIRS